jgi:molecular chaperone DnaJ
MDYYETLGIAKNASKEEIKKAYKRLAKQYHPDISTEADAEAKFKEVSEAYSVLSDDQKRQQYDRFGSDAFKGGSQGFSGFDFSGFDPYDIFEQFFGSGFGGQRRAARASDLRYDLRVGLEDIYYNREKTVSLRKRAKCTQCDGSGAASPDAITTCRTCGGIGRIRQHRQTILGVIQTEGTCPDCRGSGRRIEKPCPQCRGEGVEMRTKKITIQLRGDYDTGDAVRIKGEGEPGLSGARDGDLYIVLHVDYPKGITRKGLDLHLSTSVPFTEAILGAKKTLSLFDETIEYEIPPGSQPSDVISVRGKGITTAGRSGDIKLTLTIELPRKLNKKQRELIEAFSKTKSGLFG